MNTGLAIKAENLTKIYKLYEKPLDRVKESLNPFGRKYHTNFYALNDVTFEINKGETIGIIGQNGSGKSTLLKMLSGVLTPTFGSITVNGRVSALLELGTGFNPELTGIENIYLNGTIMGFNREQMNDRLNDILSFADIGDFVHQPVKMYSSGMFVRLAFSVATSVQPEILVVDEALSVGDMFFQAKCLTRMKQMMDKGTTLLFVSHDTGAIKSICQKCILLNKGKMIYYDKADKVVEEYFALKVKSEQSVFETEEGEKSNELLPDILADEQTKSVAFYNNAEFQKRAAFQRIQNRKAGFINIQLLNEKGYEIASIDYEQNVILRMAVEVNEDLPYLCYGYHIRDKNGIDVVYSDSAIENRNIDSPKKGDRYLIDWKFKASLIQGTYNIACVLSIPINLEIGQVEFCDFVPLAVQFNMAPRKGAQMYGNVHWDNFVNIENVTIGEQIC